MKSVSLAYKTFSFIPKKYQKNLIIFFFGILINSTLEMISLASVIPVLVAFVDPIQLSSFIEENKLHFINDLSLTFPNLKFETFLLGFAILFFFFLITLKNLFTFFFIIYRAKIIYKISLEIRSSKIKDIIFSPYSSYLKRDNTHILQDINWLNNLIVALENYLNIFTESFILFFILVLILFTNFLASISIFFLFLIIFLIIKILSKKKIVNLGNLRKINEREQLKVINNILNGIREIKIFILENFFIKKFIFFTENSLNANRKYFIYSSLPKIVIEISIAISILMIFTISLYSGVAHKTILLTLGLFAASTFKVIPSINKITISYNQLKYVEKIVEALYKKKITEKIEINDKIEYINFNGSIKFENLSFAYNSENKIINNFNLEILKGQKIALIGNSGAGKSTIINLIIGLLPSSNGSIYFDKKKITSKYFINNCRIVSQNPFYFNDTILNNICLDTEKIDYFELNKVAGILELNNLVNRSDTNLKLIIGEKGSNMSGGQLQRINLARALYAKPDLLILDEATNALDKEAEQRILKKIFDVYKGVTIILITHNSENVKLCEKVVTINY
jgi:ATP-binding cassette, subfamily B, bacterial PglK